MEPTNAQQHGSFFDNSSRSCLICPHNQFGVSLEADCCYWSVYFSPKLPEMMCDSHQHAAEINDSRVPRDDCVLWNERAMCCKCPPFTTVAAYLALSVIVSYYFSNTDGLCVSRTTTFISSFVFFFLVFSQSIVVLKWARSTQKRLMKSAPRFYLAEGAYR